MLNNKLDEIEEYVIKLQEENKRLKEEINNLKIGKEVYKHFKGDTYTVLLEGVIDEHVGPNAAPDTVYIGKAGIKWRRPSEEFHGYHESGVKRFSKF